MRYEVVRQRIEQLGIARRIRADPIIGRQRRITLSGRWLCGVSLLVLPSIRAAPPRGRRHVRLPGVAFVAFESPAGLLVQWRFRKSPDDRRGRDAIARRGGRSDGRRSAIQSAFLRARNKNLGENKPSCR